MRKNFKRNNDHERDIDPWDEDGYDDDEEYVTQDEFYQEAQFQSDHDIIMATFEMVRDIKHDIRRLKKKFEKEFKNRGK